MSYGKQIVCLASSKKPGGRCVAGREILQKGYGGWIRPVSARPSAEISLDERQYSDGKEPQILDVIEIPMIAAVPRVHQIENQMIDHEYYWTKTGSLNWGDLEDMEETPDSLWLNGDSTYHGRNDRVLQNAAASLNSSLLLIQPQDVTIRVLTPGADFGNPKRAVRADFQYNGTRYNLKVTDLTAEQIFLAKQNGNYEIDQDLYFCVSLAEAHTDGYCYKLVATIFNEHQL